MLSAAAEKHPSLTLELADGEKLQYTARFDAIFSNAALHWMPNAEAVVQGMHRALRPNGRLVAEFGGRGCVACVKSACSATLMDLGEDPSRWFRWYFPSIGQYASILEANGFVPESARLFPRPTPMPGDDGLRRWLELFLTPLVAHLGSRWPEFASKVAERCRDQLFSDGAWFIDYVRLRVVARRADDK
jgi:trans-aconitate methyltransferase